MKGSKDNLPMSFHLKLLPFDEPPCHYSNGYCVTRNEDMQIYNLLDCFKVLRC
jgi:hypothetical protein